MTYLLDTNAVSEPTKPKPNPGYAAWYRDAADTELFTTAITLGELRKGTALLPPGERRQRYEAVHRELADWFGDRVLAIDSDVALIWGELSARLRREGKPRGMADELVAATALTHGLTVVTRNVADFEGTGCKIHCPWT